MLNVDPPQKGETTEFISYNDEQEDLINDHQTASNPLASFDKLAKLPYRTKICFSIVLVALFLTIFIYSVLAEFQKINKNTTHELQLKLEKIKEVVEKDIEISFQESLAEINKMNEKLQEEIKSVEKTLDKQSGLIELRADSRLEDERSRLEKQYTDINAKLTELLDSGEQKNLYSIGEFQEKHRYEISLEGLLRQKNPIFQTVMNHRYSFRLNDTAEDPEPHTHSNQWVDFTTPENQLPMCVVVPAYRDHPHYVIQHTLNSIFRQNYTKYMAVIFSSPVEKTSNFIQNYLNLKKISSRNYVFVRDGITSPLQNIHTAVHKHCAEESIVFVLEGGNCFFNRETLRTFNDAHVHGLNVVAFSNHFKLSLADRFVNWGDTVLPSASEVQTRSYREKPYYQLLSFRAAVFREIAIADLRDSSGRFLDAWVFPIMLPLLELSCGYVKRITGIHAVEYINEQYWGRVTREKEAFDVLRTRQPYSCSKHLEALKKEKVHNHPFLQQISTSRRQKGGLVPVATTDPAAFDPHRINSQGQTIVDILYPKPSEKQWRKYFHEKRIQFIKDKSNYLGINLIKHNLKLDKSMDDLQKNEEQTQYNRLNELYHFDQYKQELPMCLVVCSYNNNINMRIEYNLNSIFRQNYSNYFAVIINDASNDGSDFTYRKYLNFHNIPTDKYVYIESHKRATALENIYNAIHNHCSNDSIAMTVDGDDQLIGRNVLKVFNANYQRLKAGFLYTNYYTYVVGNSINWGNSRHHTLQERQTIMFREIQVKNSQIRSFNTSLFLSIDKSNFQDASGQFYKMAYDVAITIPTMQRACGKVYFIPQVNYLYNYMTGSNDFQADPSLQMNIAAEIRKKKKLECDPYFKTVPLLNV